MSSFNRIPKRTDQSINMDGYINVSRQAKKLNNIQFDHYDFQVLDDSSGVFVALNAQTNSSIDNINFTIDNLATNTVSGKTTFDIHGGRIFLSSNSGTSILNGDPSFFGGQFVEYYDNVYSANTTSDSFVCAHYDNANPTVYTIEIKPLAITNPPMPPEYFNIGYVKIPAGNVASKVTQLEIGDIYYANGAGSIAVDDLSIQFNVNTSTIQIMNYPTACADGDTNYIGEYDVIPYKEAGGPGIDLPNTKLKWTNANNFSDVVCFKIQDSGCMDTYIESLIDCEYINACITAANSPSAILCQALNETDGSSCLCNWLDSHPDCIPDKKNHTELNFGPTAWGMAGYNDDHSDRYWVQGFGATYCYGTDIGDITKTKVVDLNGEQLIIATGMLAGVSLDWGTKKLLGNWSCSNNFTIDGTTTMTGIAYANSNTTATNATSGGLQVVGGIGCQGNVWASSFHSSSYTYQDSTGFHASPLVYLDGVELSLGSHSYFQDQQLQVDFNNVWGPYELRVGVSAGLSFQSGGTLVENILGATIVNGGHPVANEGTAFTANCGGTPTTFYIRNGRICQS